MTQCKKGPLMYIYKKDTKSITWLDLTVITLKTGRETV